MYKDKLDRLNRSRVDHLPSQGGLRYRNLLKAAEWKLAKHEVSRTAILLLTKSVSILCLVFHLPAIPNFFSKCIYWRMTWAINLTLVGQNLTQQKPVTKSQSFLNSDSAFSIDLLTAPSQSIYPHVFLPFVSGPDPIKNIYAVLLLSILIGQSKNLKQSEYPNQPTT